MKRILLALVLGGLLLAGPAAETALAQRRGGSSSGRSFSSGGRSYSSGGRSFSGGKSYSSGRSSSSGGKAFSSSPSRSTLSTKTYTAGSGSRPSSRTMSPSVGPSDGLGGRSFTSGGSSSSKKSSGGARPSAAGGARPVGPSFDSLAAAERRRAESREAFERGTRPRPTYTTPAGKPKPISPDSTTETLRRKLDHDRWVHRQQRQEKVFRDTVPGSVVRGPVYHDPYSFLFWLWLLEQDRETRARWAYHHRDAMDAARYRELLARDPRLEDRVRQLEADKDLKRNATHVPKGIGAYDLMFDDEYVDAVYNPEAVEVARSDGPAVPPRPSGTGETLLTVVFVLVVVGLLIWLVFFKRFGGVEVAPSGRGR